MKGKQVIEQMNISFRSFKNEFTILMNIFVQRNKVQSWASDDQLHKQANTRKLLQKREVQVTKPLTHPLSGYVLPLGAYPTDVGNVRHRQKLPRTYFHHLWYYHVYLRKFIIQFSWLCEGLSEHSMLAELLLFWPGERLLLNPQDNSSSGTYSDLEITAFNRCWLPQWGPPHCVSSQGLRQWAFSLAVCTGTGTWEEHSQ